MSVADASLVRVSWTDVVDFVGGLIPRRAKPIIGLTFAILLIAVPPARAAVVALGEAIIRDTSASLTRSLMPAVTPLVTLPATND